MLEPMATVNRPSGHGSCELDFVSEIVCLAHVTEFGSVACFSLLESDHIFCSLRDEIREIYKGLDSILRPTYR